MFMRFLKVAKAKPPVDVCIRSGAFDILERASGKVLNIGFEGEVIEKSPDNWSDPR